MAMSIYRSLFFVAVFGVGACAGAQKDALDEPIMIDQSPNPASVVLSPPPKPIPGRDAGPNPTYDASPSDAGDSTLSPLPKVSGFHCFEAREKPDDTRFLGLCFRTQNECQVVLRHSQSANFHFTDCKPAAQATCYRVHNPLEESDKRECFVNMMHCLRDLIKAKEEQPDYVQFGECKTLK